MIINTTQVEMVLNNKAIPAYSLEAETGVSRDRISKLRRGDIKFENMSLKTIMKIQKWIDDGNYRFSYDYTELINELKGLGTRLALPRMQQRAIQIAGDQLDSLKTHMLPPKPLINSKTDFEWQSLKARLAHTRA